MPLFTLAHISPFILPFAVAFVSTVSVLIILVRVCKYFTFLRTPRSSRHVGHARALRIGGVALCAGFLVAVFASPDLILDERSWVFLLVVSALTCVGFVDDIWALSWRWQIGAQISAGLVLFLAGIRIDFISLPFGVVYFDNGVMLGVGLLILLLWIVAIMNVINWIDGIDGLAGGVTLIAAVTLCAISLSETVYQPPLAIMLAACAGCALAFTLVNIGTGKVFAGSSGSYFMGSALAILAIFAGAKIGTALLVLVVPVADAVSVLYDRLRHGVSIFSPDMRHLHHRLLTRGWSVRRILTLYYGLTIIGALCALATSSYGKVALFSVYSALVVFVLVFVIAKTDDSRVAPQLSDKNL